MVLNAHIRSEIGVDASVVFGSCGCIVEAF
jgi:hypothetical protein